MVELVGRSWVFELALDLDLSLKLLGVLQLLAGDERNDHAGSTSAGGAAGTVGVGLVVFGWVEVHDAVDAVDVNATGRHIGGD